MKIVQEAVLDESQVSFIALSGTSLITLHPIKMTKSVTSKDLFYHVTFY